MLLGAERHKRAMLKGVMLWRLSPSALVKNIIPAYKLGWTAWQLLDLAVQPTTRCAAGRRQGRKGTTMTDHDTEVNFWTAWFAANAWPVERRDGDRSTVFFFEDEDGARMITIPKSAR
jgi:hypothetical protein